MPIFISLLFAALVTPVTHARDYSIPEQLKSEFLYIHQAVQGFSKSETVGGYFYTKSFGDYEILWRLADESGHDQISIFRERPDGREFMVTYYRATHIVPGRTVIRRFMGPAISGWRADTIDAQTGEYLGMQGSASVHVDRREREILKEWGIEVFN